MSRQAPRNIDGKRVSSELFTLTYGALVTQLLKDYENDEDVNKQLDRMGYNIGVRLIEDYLARSNAGRCFDFRDTADKIQARILLAANESLKYQYKLGFKMFLGISPAIQNWSPAADEFSLVLENNPLAEFVELPEEHSNLKFSNIIVGVLRGALEMVQMDVAIWFVQDQLKGDNVTEIRVKFLKRLEDALPAGED